VRERLARWRQRHGGPGKRIPEELWAEAAELARVDGVAATARALRLDRHRLQARMRDEGQEVKRNGRRPRRTRRRRVSAEAGGGFVEIAASALGAATGQTVLRFEGNDGEQLHVEVSGSSGVDVVAIARAFWSRGR
jgi:hypothetical protein